MNVPRSLRLLPSSAVLGSRRLDTSLHTRASQQTADYYATSIGHYRLPNNLRCMSTHTSAGVSGSSRSKTFDEYRKALGLRTQEDYIRLDRGNCAPNYSPTPVVISRGEGVYVWDTDGNRYFDFVSGISVRLRATISCFSSARIHTSCTCFVKQHGSLFFGCAECQSGPLPSSNYEGIGNTSQTPHPNLQSVAQRRYASFLQIY